MKTLLVIAAVSAVTLVWVTGSCAQEMLAPSLLDRTNQQYEVAQPCPGQGYVPYELPAVDSCPCSYERCFHPCRYYFGGKEYVKSWRRLWVRSHLGHASMLDAYPCECQFPGLTRPYWKTSSAATPAETMPAAE